MCEVFTGNKTETQKTIPISKQATVVHSSSTDSSDSVFEFIDKSIKTPVSSDDDLPDCHYARLAEIAYSDNPPKTFKGYELQEQYLVTDTKSGFAGAVYKKDNEVIILYRGCDKFSGGSNNKKSGCTKNDLSAVWNITIGALPKEQYEDALKLYESVANNPKYKGCSFKIIGHSLGGALAQLVASSKFKNPKTPIPSAVTFNAYGTAGVVTDDDYKNIFLQDLSIRNIKNYINKDDYISNLKKHVGKNVLFKSKDKDENATFSHHGIKLLYSSLDFKLAVKEAFNSTLAEKLAGLAKRLFSCTNEPNVSLKKIAI